MNWVIDLGNTSLKWAACHEDGIEESCSVLWEKNDIAQTLDEAWGEFPSPDKITCSCVAGEQARNELTQWCLSVWGIEPHYIKSEKSECGVVNAYLDAPCLGSDRWAALIGAKHEIDQACCIVDCGTAATIDVLQQDGQHLGGLILPGIALMRSALLDGTTVVIDNSEESNSMLFARNTHDAIQGGGLYAMIATIDRVFQDVEAELGVDVKKVLTGGDASTLLPLLQGDIKYLPDLVLQGLFVIASESNKNKGAQ